MIPSPVIGAQLETALHPITDLEAALAAFGGFWQSQFPRHGPTVYSSRVASARRAPKMRTLFHPHDEAARGRGSAISRMRPCVTAFAPAAIMNQSWLEYCKMNPCGRPLGGAGKGAARRTAAVHAVSRAGSPLLW